MGCQSSTSPEAEGGELPSGSYFILSEADDSYQYEQYFVIQPGHRWEFVEYGFKSGAKTLCQATRQKGVYSATDSTMTLTMQGASESLEKCGMTKSDFAAIPFETAPAGQTAIFEIRNVSDTGFEGLDIFDGTSSGWQRYAKKADPFGFF